MGDLDEELQELDRWYAGTSDRQVNDIRPVGCVRELFYYAVQTAYGAVPDPIRRRFEQCLHSYETLDPILQRRFRGILTIASVMAAVAERRREAAGLVLSIAQLLPSAFSGLSEEDERALVQTSQQYLEGDPERPPDPSIEKDLAALRDLLVRSA
ncbi:hypothetical protein HY642_05380 [Candidatus Woesearchaeota archaeon]|nr:hypothetical protein [Candidatus Woesearchaeota archaeon]